MLTCWSHQRVVQSGQGQGLLFSQPHPDLLPDPPGFSHRVRRGAVRRKHISGARRVRLQGGQKAALRHHCAHPHSGERSAWTRARRHTQREHWLRQQALRLQSVRNEMAAARLPVGGTCEAGGGHDSVQQWWSRGNQNPPGAHCAQDSTEIMSVPWWCLSHRNKPANQSVTTLYVKVVTVDVQKGNRWINK